VTSASFPLPTLGPRLQALAQSLHAPDGDGFAVISGLDTTRFSTEENMIVYLGICAHIGSERGKSLARSRNSRQMVVPLDKRHGIHTNSALPFHNDMGCELLCLQYREIAQKGGATSVSSAAAIFADLEESFPKELATLMSEDWPVQLSAKPARFARLPLIAKHNGRVIISVDPGRLGLHPATAALRGGDCMLSEDQLRALSTLAQLADEHAVSIAARPGDMLFINNFALLHKRDAYTDADTRRHLVRLWLRNPELSWEIPDNMKEPWKAAYGSLEGTFGYFLMPADDCYQIVPEKEYKLPRYCSGSAAWLMEE
ncbi:hypothetical protein BD289DRAFT_354084, partial [Coniella lustricola]